MAKLSKRKKAQQKKAQTPEAKAEQSRRQFLKLARNGAIGIAAAGGAGFFMMRSVRAMQAEQDLTRVGQGKPVIVQVHDPQCPTCTALQKEVRNAMKQFGECDLVYLVADIRQTEGATFANRHGVPHVTLLLFDGDGELRQTLHGMRYRDELRQVLRTHHDRYGVTA
ncbi:MAG: thioredoxin family protein [Paracoccaceae bacterium]